MPDITYICNRTADEPHPQILSNRENCSTCNNPVWVDPDKYSNAAERGDVTLICSVCYGEAQAKAQEKIAVDEYDIGADIDEYADSDD